MVKLDNLQVLRAVAAIAVLVGHALNEAQSVLGVHIALTHLPWANGVDLFFVLSGVLIGLSLLTKPDSPAAFLRRRIIRVAPLYYVFTTLIVAVLWLAPDTLKDTTYDPGHILSSYLFVPYAREDGRIAPVLSLGWTLNYEMFFYALAAASLVSRRPWAVLLGMVALCASLRPLASDTALAQSWTSPLLLEFSMGLGLARLYQSGLRLSTSGAAVLILVGLFWLGVTHAALPRWISAGGAALLITGAGLLGPTLSWPKVLITLGDASYALYLSHRFVLRPISLVAAPWLSASLWHATLYTLLATLASLAVGLAVYRHIEVPILRALRHPQRLCRPA